MILKSYTNFSDKDLIEHLNGIFIIRYSVAFRLTLFMD